MNTFTTLEPIIREIKKIVNNLLLPQSPFDKIIAICNRFMALRDVTNFENIKHELNLAFGDIDVYVSKLRALINRISK